MKKTLIILGLILIPLPCWAINAAIHGMMSMGSGGGCDPASNEVGDRTTYAESGTLNTDEYYAIAHTADCSGELDTAYIKAWGGANCKVCIYSDNGDGVPNDAGDLKLWCSGVMGSADTWDSATGDVGIDVTNGVTYWIVTLSGGNTVHPYRTTAGSKRLYYGAAQAGDYTNPPANLGNLSSQISAANRDQSCYVTIK